VEALEGAIQIKVRPPALNVEKVSLSLFLLKVVCILPPVVSPAQNDSPLSRRPSSVFGVSEGVSRLSRNVKGTAALGAIYAWI
jgi:hypothetical protein